MEAETTGAYLESLKRKERLLKLKRNREENEINETSETVKRPLPPVKFRNYNSEDLNVKENTLPGAKPVDVENEIKDELNVSGPIIEEVRLSTLAPNESEYDLKRDVGKKLARLEKRTNKAIAELIRERLKTDQMDLATSVNIGARANCKLDIDDDDD